MGPVQQFATTWANSGSDKNYAADVWQWGIHYWNLPTRVGGAYLVRDEHVERRETNSYIINSALTSYFRFWEYTWLGKCISNTGIANRGKKKLSHALDMLNFICWFMLSCSLKASKPSNSIWHFMLSFKHTSRNLHKPPRHIWSHVHCSSFKWTENESAFELN